MLALSIATSLVFSKLMVVRMLPPACSNTVSVPPLATIETVRSVPSTSTNPSVLVCSSLRSLCRMLARASKYWKPFTSAANVPLSSMISSAPASIDSSFQIGAMPGSISGSLASRKNPVGKSSSICGCAIGRLPVFFTVRMYSNSSPGRISSSPLRVISRALSVVLM